MREGMREEGCSFVRGRGDLRQSSREVSKHCGSGALGARGTNF